MTKILVTGNAGAGKSTLARRLAASMDLPFHSLDGIVWQAGWQQTPKPERDELIRALCRTDSWVIDGVSTVAQEAADILVFLDVPRHRCLRRAMRRNLPYLFKSRPELPDNCPEFKIIPTLLKIIWQFDSRVRPRILAEGARRSPSAFLHVRNPRELQDCERHLIGSTRGLDGSPHPNM